MITRKRTVTVLVALIFYFSAVSVFASDCPVIRAGHDAGFIASIIKTPILLLKDILVIEQRVQTDGLPSLVNLGIRVLTGSLQMLRHFSEIGI